jgi:hypothetical protein
MDSKIASLFSPAPNAPRKDLANDEGGAVMIMGLAMILALIAFLWYLLGIGETLAFRDHMQDAADSAAFSQTAVEAAGMNLIVFLNLCIMLLVIAYLLFSLLVTACWALMVGTCICCVSVICDFGDPAACPSCLDLALSTYPDLYSARGKAATVMSKFDFGLSLIESAVAVAAPWGGTAAGINASTNYKMSSMTKSPIGISLSPNNFFDISTLLSSKGSDLTMEYGLPVTHEILGNDCFHVIDMAGGTLLNLVGSSGKGNKIIGQLKSWFGCDNSAEPPMPFPNIIPKKIMKYLNALSSIERELIGGGDAGSYWTDPGYGPMKNWSHKDVDRTSLQDAIKGTNNRHKPEQKNGADHNQSYSVLVMPGDLSDHHATHNIGLMQMQHLQGFYLSEQAAKPLFYFAQAELYFDCDKGWNSPDCDDITDNIDRMDLTMYSFSWRARLVAFHPPSGGLAKAFDVINKGLSMVTSVKGWINGLASNPFIQALNFLDQLTGLDIIGAIASFADMVPDQVFH